MDWRKVTIPATSIDDRDPRLLRRQIITIYEENGRPKDFCILVQEHPDPVYYFSPVAATLCDSLFNEISQYYEVLPCDAAEVGGTLSVGDSDLGKLADLLIRSRA
jgi:hypothetical protein